LSSNVDEKTLQSGARQVLAREVVHASALGTLGLGLANRVDPPCAPQSSMAGHFESRTSCFVDASQEAAHQPSRPPTMVPQPNGSDMSPQPDIRPDTSTLQPDEYAAVLVQQPKEKLLPNVAQQGLSSPFWQGAVCDVSHGVSPPRVSQLAMGSNLRSNIESPGSCFVNAFQGGGLQLESQSAVVPQPHDSFMTTWPDIQPALATPQSHLCRTQSMEPEPSQGSESGSRMGKGRIKKVAVLLPVGLVAPAIAAELSFASAALEVLPSVPPLPATHPLPVGLLPSTASSSGDLAMPSSALAAADIEAESMAYAYEDGAIPDVTAPVIGHSPDDITTVIIRQIPSGIPQSQLLQMWPVTDVGYNLLYAPFNNKKRRSMGYAFMNFTSHRALLEFHGNWHGAVLEGGPESGGLIIEAANLQGLEANLQHMRCSKLIRSIRRIWQMPIVVLADGTFADFRQVMAEINSGASAEGADGEWDEEEEFEVEQDESLDPTSVATGR